MDILKRITNSIINDLIAFISAVLEGIYKGSLFYAAITFIMLVSSIASNTNEFIKYFLQASGADNPFHSWGLEVIKYYAFCVAGFIVLFLIRNTMRKGRSTTDYKGIDGSTLRD
ncbi:hypothetical protein FTH31_23175 [Salmonella enterica]|nr:hypothetical protein [Salmonella enterica]